MCSVSVKEGVKGLVAWNPLSSEEWGQIPYSPKSISAGAELGNGMERRIPSLVD